MQNSLFADVETFSTKVSGSPQAEIALLLLLKYFSDKNGKTICFSKKHFKKVDFLLKKLNGILS